MPADNHYDAIKLLAQVSFERDKGRLERAVELLDEVVALGAQDAEFRREYPYLMAHVELYKAHHARGDEEQARDYYAKAVRLGATVEQLATKD
jgi:tetratricopeptide (TPR) repeat protein